MFCLGFWGVVFLLLFGWAFWFWFVFYFGFFGGMLLFFEVWGFVSVLVFLEVGVVEFVFIFLIFVCFFVGFVWVCLFQMLNAMLKSKGSVNDTLPAKHTL